MDNTLSFYGLSQYPFPGAGAPAEKFESFDLRQAVAVAKLTAKENGVGLLTGPVGIGVSYAAYCASRELDPTHYTSRYYPVCDITPRDFYKGLCRITDTECREKGRDALIASLRRQVKVMKSQGRPLFLTLDNAQNLPTSVLRDIPTLVMEDYSIRSGMAILFCGTEDLKDRIRAMSDAALLQMVDNHYSFRGLTQEECREYVLQRLRLAGATREMIHKDALNALHALSCMGNCRMLNKLMQNALRIGAQAQRPMIDMTVLRSAADHLVI